MKPTLKYLMLFVTSGIVCLSTSIATTAAAWETRTHPSACMTLGGAPIDLAFGIQNDGAAPMVVLCAARDETGAAKQTTTALNIHGYDDTTVGSVIVAQCRSLAFATGGACGAGVSTSSPGLGNFALSVPVAGFWNANTATDFGYVFISVPAKQGSAFRSIVRGVYQAGT